MMFEDSSQGVSRLVILGKAMKMISQHPCLTKSYIKWDEMNEECPSSFLPFSTRKLFSSNLSEHLFKMFIVLFIPCLLLSCLIPLLLFFVTYTI